MALYGYARVSTIDQNPQLQFDALRQAGVDEERTFTDYASGTAEDRPNLRAVLDAVEKGDVLVVWRLDRLGRSTTHLIRTIEDLGTRGVEFRSLREAIDTTTPAGRFLFRTIASMAEFERDLIVERTLAGLEAAKAAGVKLGRPSVVTEESAELIHELSARGMTQEEIARRLRISRSTVGRVVRRARWRAGATTDDGRGDQRLPCHTEKHG